MKVKTVAFVVLGGVGRRVCHLVDSKQIGPSYVVTYQAKAACGATGRFRRAGKDRGKPCKRCLERCPVAP